MQNALQTLSSETTSAKLLLAAENSAKLLLARNFPSFQQPIVALPMLLPKMTFVGHFASRLSTRKISMRNTFFSTNLSISEAYFCLKTTQKARRGMQDHLYLVFFQ